jgi:3-hydroxyisobutyrate dehydrogenase-like beta-hydroxyacid dehydrogenase
MHGSTIYVDCNAIAPETMTTIAGILAGTRCVDVGIIGGPPRDAYAPRFYASGPDAPALLALEQNGLRVRVLAGDVGVASAFKCCYAGITKGFTAIGSVMLAAAQSHDLRAELDDELSESQPALKAWLDRQLPMMPPKAYRWVAEMREIGRASGDPSADAIYNAIADFYATVARERGDAVRDVLTKGTA